MQPQASKPPQPVWAKVLRVTISVIGFLLLIVLAIGLRILRRQEPGVMALLGGILLAALALIMGGGYLVHLLVEDARRARPSVGLAIAKAVMGLLLFIPFFVGFDLNADSFGLLRTAKFGYQQTFIYAMPVAVGICLVLAGGFGLIGRRLGWVAGLVLLAALVPVLGFGAPLTSPLQLVGELDKDSSHRTAFTADGQKLVQLMKDATSQTWNLDPLRLEGKSSVAPGSPGDYFISPHGTLVVTLTEDRLTMRETTAANPKWSESLPTRHYEERRRHPAYVWFISEELLGLRIGPQLQIRRCDDGQLQGEQVFPKEPRLIAVAPNGSLVAAVQREDITNDYHLGVWRTGEQAPFLAPKEYTDIEIHSLTFDPASKQLAAGYESFAILFELENKRQTMLIKGDRQLFGYCTDLWFSTDGNRILTSWLDDHLIVFDRQGQRLLHVQHVPGLVANASPDGKWLITTGHNEPLRLWRFKKDW